MAKDTLGVYRYRYNLTDHLGSVRATIRESIATPGTLQVMQRDNYYAFGLTQVAGTRNNKYLYNSKELQTELGQYDYGARFYDPVIGRWNVVDPLADVYQTLTPYAYVMNNPLKFNDPTGMFSTHTDEEGNVVAVYDDGDLGVYKHKGNSNEASKNLEETYSKNNTSAGGKKMGESIHSLSFADQNLYNATGDVEAASMKINFGSNELTNKVNNIVEGNPSILEYVRKARTDGNWDLKSNTTNGSLLYGKYASPRDAGNFAAGIIAQMSGMDPVVQFGYGAYNLTKNNLVLTGLLTVSVGALTAINPVTGLGVGYLIGKYGEDKLTQRAIDLGKQHVKKHR